MNHYVTATTDLLSDIGRYNIENIKFRSGLFRSIFGSKGKKKINKFCLKTIGDISWPEHVAIFTANSNCIKRKIRLIIWENSQTEYGGPEEDSKKNILDRNWLQEFGGMGALRVDDLTAIEDIDIRV